MGELAQKAADQGKRGPQSGKSDNLSGHNSWADCKPIAEIAVGIAEPCRSENVKWEGGPISGDRVKIASLGPLTHDVRVRTEGEGRKPKYDDSMG